ncbi:hypothetical protein ACRYCC_07640 [Actinomadura scrupuli]|uniref:hypothetical protein n=1 Tax=Actinomadura scrupuli TaxID=559629 RepID=UPI003D959182
MAEFFALRHIVSVAIFNAVLPVITLILGFFGSLLLEGRRDKRTLERERLARRAQWDEQDRRDRLAFERQGLTEAHSVIRDLVDELHDVIPLLAAAHKSGQSWHEYPGGEAAKQRIMAANVRRGHVATLVLDRFTSEAIGRVGSAALPLYMDSNALKSEQRRNSFYQAVSDSLEAIADRLRMLYSTNAIQVREREGSQPDSGLESRP